MKKTALRNFIKKRPYLIWYVRDLESLSEESIVEHTLNYGNWEDVQKLIEILGMKRVAKIFRKQARQKRCNYYPMMKNFFKLYFAKHA